MQLDAAHGTKEEEAASTNRSGLETDNVELNVVVPFFATTPGQHLVLVGSTPRLGGWEVAHALPLTWSEGHRWTLTKSVPRSALTEAACKVRTQVSQYS